ncbi:MAG: bifunctional diaminohydroxyphosphoribosylaminopyrimidine deaminase/5-amino-6-(5-phosphoribosylamino)uracil reductase RibD [Thioalkalivibrio sp.]|nr:bifunctional diaminohydroxyphosphoribosylaminopyrimidine deaminase/5-amino-6-(5-phosphoribosylamino)uracil reductase RibD [Thioalkalivibrio sp.]
MGRALQLAELGLYTTDPNPRVGSVVVRDGKIVGEGAHWRAGEPHAEIHALRAAGDLVRGATVYITLEPCAHHGRTPPCADALVAAGVARVVVAMQDPNPLVSGRGLERLRAEGIAVENGVLEFEARALNPGFVRRMETGRPWVRVKLASSLDGRTAMASGESKWITGPAARRDVQHWRARASAILTGSGTVLADDPHMTVRLSPAELLSDRGIDPARHSELKGIPARQPLRVVVDSELQMPLQARLLDEGAVLVLTSAHRADSDKAGELRARGAEVLGMPALEEGRLELSPVLDLLGERGVNELHVEAGSGLAGALARHGLVDEWLFYLAPCLMGSGARPLLDWPLQHMAERAELDVFACDWIGDALRLRAYPLPAGTCP